MTRIDAADLRRSGVLADPRALVAALGLDSGAERQRRGIIIRCPWHADRSPSCSVTREKDGTIGAHCFACGANGDALALVAAVHGLDVRADFRRVAALAAELAGRTDLTIEPATADDEGEAAGLSDETYAAIWSFALERCPLTLAPSVAAYLEARGVFADAEAAGVRGFPDAGADRAALVRALLGAFDRADLEAAEVLRRGRDALDWADRWPLLIPWRDRWGRVQCVQRRRLDGEKRRKYHAPQGRSVRAPFGVDLLGEALAFLGPTAEVIIAEGALDALARRRLARHRGELAAVVGIYSASTPTVGLPLDLLEGRRVVLATDADDEGEGAAEAIRDALPDDADVVRERPADRAKDWADLAACEAWRDAS